MEENKKESKEDKKKEEKLKKEEIKRQKEAQKREEKAKKEEEKRLKKEQKAKEKEMRQSLNKSIKSSKKSGHMKLKSSGQLLPSNIHNFDFIINELPESFFEEILINEMDLSEQFSIEKLSSLIKLYSRAMEFYLQNDPSKANYYQGRMEYLLTNKDTLRKLKKESENINKKNNIENIENNIVNKSKAEMKKNIEYKTDSLIFDDISQKVSEVIEDSNMKGDKKTVKNIIEEDLEKQNLSWKEKLKNKKMLRSSMNIGGNKLNFDISKRRSAKIKSSTDEKLNIGSKKLEKMKYILDKDIYEEVKEENEGEGSDKESDEKKEEIIDNLENLRIVNDDDNIEEKKDENKEEKKIEKKIETRPRKKSIVDKDVIRNVDIDDKILTSVNQRMDLLMKLIGDIERNKIKEEEDDIENIENDEKKENKDILSGIKANIINIPIKFQSTYYQVENLMQIYMDEFNNFYYKDIFEQFASKLKEIYDNKYKKYIDISVEYHNHIKKNEHILENNDNLNEEKKNEIQQIIDSLKDEQQNEIAKIEDEFNRLIVSKVNEFKINSFKNNSGIQLIEEQLKLDIYSLINDSFY